MNSRNRIIYSLASLLLVAGCGAVMERRTAHIERRWPAGAIKHIEVLEIDGAINIEAGSDAEIVMDATVRSRIAPKANQEKQGDFTPEVRAATLSIGTR